MCSCDFGVAVQCADVNALMMDTTVPVGKVKFYMPPEVFARQAYSPAKVDVWTAGIILFVMLTKVHPFKYATAADARFMMVYSGKMNELLRRWGKEPLHPHAEDLLRRMLCPPEQRLLVDDILRHPYVREETAHHEQPQRPLAPVEEDGKWQPQQQPPLPHQQSHYDANERAPSASRQVLSPTSPSYHLPPSISVYSNPPSSLTSPPPSRPTYPTGSQPAGPAGGAGGLPSAQRPQLQPSYQHPLDGQSLAPAGPAVINYQQPAPVPQPSAHYAHVMAQHRPPPPPPAQQAPTQQPIRYQRTQL